MVNGESKKKRRIGLVITLIINLLIVGYIAITEFGPGSHKEVEEVAFSDIKIWYLAFGLACFLVALFSDYLKYRRSLMFAEGRLDRRGAVECAIIGKYYDNVTPFGAGGQPFQIHYLKKRGYSTGTSAAAPAIGVLTQQMAFVVIGLVVFIANHSVLEQLSILNITAYIGLFMYALFPIALLTFSVFPRPFLALVRWIAKIGGKLHLIKDVDATIAKWLASFDEYKRCLLLFCKHPFVFTKLMLFSCMYQMAILSVPFFMIRAFGGTGDWWTIFSIVVFIYATITIVPTPGNAGAAEGLFYAVFSSLEGGMLFWAMIGWRLLVYYSWLICGLIVIARSTVRQKERLQRPPHEGPLRVAQFIDIFYPSVDGVVRTVDAYARNINKNGNSAFVVYPKQREKLKESLPYETFPLHSFRFPGLDFDITVGIPPKNLKAEFKNNTPDVLHAHSPFFAGRMALRLGRKYHRPVVATFHSKYYDDALNVTHSKILAKIFLAIVVDFYIRADYVWACSQSTAETLRSYGYNGRIYIMENGIDTDNAPKDIKALEPKVTEAFPTIPNGRKTLLFVGQMIWQKGLKVILDTLKKLVEIDKSYFLILAGTGYNEKEIKDYVKKYGLLDYTYFTGKIIDRELLFGLYSHSDLFFFPSLYDNAPLVLREAAMASTPALLSKGSNSAEIVEDGVNGFTEEPDAGKMADKIRAIFSDGKIAEVGRKACETIPVSWGEIVDRAMLAYRTGSKEGHEHMLGTLFGE